LRLLLVTGEFPEMIGGVGDHSAWLGRGLERLGHQVTVLTAADPRVAAIPGLDVHPVVTKWKGASLARRCVEGKPQVLLLQYAPYLYQRLGLPLGLLSALAAVRRRVPVVLVAHELWIPWSGPAALPLWVGQRLLAAIAVRLANVTVVSTERRHRQLLRAGVSARRLRLVRIGSSLPEPESGALPEPARSDENPDVFRVGMFASLDLQWRRPDLAVEAVRRMGAQRPKSLVELTLMGRLPENTARFLHSVPKQGPGYRVRATGVLPAAEVARRLRRCDAAVLLDTSGLGGISTRSTSSASALALGRPLVANRGPETDGLFEDGTNLLFAPLLPEAIEAALERLRDDVGLRHRLGSGAADLYRRHFSSTVVAAAFDELCRALASDTAVTPTEGAPR
jgi:glycosyltransferase involved in cell wall biosynthesis